MFWKLREMFQIEMQKKQMPGMWLQKFKGPKNQCKWQSEHDFRSPTLNLKDM